MSCGQCTSWSASYVVRSLGFGGFAEGENPWELHEVTAVRYSSGFRLLRPCCVSSLSLASLLSPSMWSVFVLLANHIQLSGHVPVFLQILHSLSQTFFSHVSYSVPLASIWRSHVTEAAGRCMSCYVRHLPMNRDNSYADALELLGGDKDPRVVSPSDVSRTSGFATE